MLVQTARSLLGEQAALEIRAIAGEYEAGLAELTRPHHPSEVRPPGVATPRPRR
jgi:uncharacterized SAM-dependent methyltransferase